jgi:hypothetical protein
MARGIVELTRMGEESTSKGGRTRGRQVAVRCTGAVGGVKFLEPHSSGGWLIATAHFPSIGGSPPSRVVEVPEVRCERNSPRGNKYLGRVRANRIIP